jgi:hypothetical protein
MLTPFQWCISVALCIDAQLVVSIRQKADSAARSLGFHRVILGESRHKRTRRKNQHKIESQENCICFMTKDLHGCGDPKAIEAAMRFGSRSK